MFKNNNRTILLITLTLIAIWFLYLERTILAPFVLGAIFAYVVNPLVNIFSHKIKLPRTLSILLVYSLIILSLFVIAVFTTNQLAKESRQLGTESRDIILNAEEQINLLPDWARNLTIDSLESLKSTTIIEPGRILPVFSSALSRIISVFIFLISAFYFLREGNKFYEKISNYLPSDTKIEAAIVIRKINFVLGNYLRGQLLLVFIMALLTWIALTVVGVKYALIISVITGFAEIVPIVGPIFAGSLATVVTVFDGFSNLNLPPIGEAAVVISVYFLLRQFEDIFIIPTVLGRVTNLHPLLILFSVLAGGHLLGVLGMILAVPIAASIKILLDYFSDKIKEAK